jgi:Uma2 family endonuclease
VDPPPDLVIEIDISSGSIKKFPVFASMGIPEVWRHDGTGVSIYRLSDSTYEQSSHSLVFPLLESTELSSMILQSANLPSIKFRKLLRNWASQIRQR